MLSLSFTRFLFCRLLEEANLLVLSFRKRCSLIFMKSRGQTFKFAQLCRTVLVLCYTDCTGSVLHCVFCFSFCIPLALQCVLCFSFCIPLVPRGALLYNVYVTNGELDLAWLGCAVKPKTVSQKMMTLLVASKISESALVLIMSPLRNEV